MSPALSPPIAAERGAEPRGGSGAARPRGAPCRRHPAPPGAPSAPRSAASVCAFLRIPLILFAHFLMYAFTYKGILFFFFPPPLFNGSRVSFPRYTLFPSAGFAGCLASLLAALGEARQLLQEHHSPQAPRGEMIQELLGAAGISLVSAGNKPGRGKSGWAGLGAAQMRDARPAPRGAAWPR